MPPSLAADAIRILVQIPGPSSSFQPLGGEERTQLTLERKPQERLALGQGRWEAQLESAGRNSLTLEAEGRSQHGPAEAHLHACAFEALPCRLRLQIGEANWIEGPFVIQRFRYDTPLGDAARYHFTALSDGVIERHPLGL